MVKLFLFICCIFRPLSLLKCSSKILVIFITVVCFNIKGQYADIINKKRLRTVIITESSFYLAGNAFLQYVWYRYHDRTKFHFYNDNKGYLQMDKCGHSFSAYQYSRKGYEALRWAGVNKKKSLIFGGPLGLVLQTPIEVFDGLYKGYGFSKGDMIANAAGSAIFSIQQALWDDQIVKMKFSYAPSIYNKYNTYGLGATPLESFFLDYNGHTYWLSGNIKSITSHKKVPSWLNVAVGYSAKGMLSEFKNYEYYNYKLVPRFYRYRQWFFSLDIDLSKIKTKNKLLKTILNQINSLKIPFPALEYNRIDKLNFRPFYY